MNAGLVMNLAITTAVQAGVGAIIATIIRRYVAQVDRISARVRELEERRITALERVYDENRAEHLAIHDAIAGRMGREEQQTFLGRIEQVSSEQRQTALQQTTTATEMRMAASQISELFGKVARLSADVARMQGRIDK